ncbi:FAD-dependent oxidoreductase [Variovorax sp. J22G21]|uniref:FAD-dependent oxidoreductase n=1 Tax=Variovorax fucosicus TaxID=3053517 RepID=UPI002578BB11|nr:MULTISPECIES: FAD-dependent oxidoreductase [unclassified Variovorax]MDM0037951.1 FAD-dependent oxidoreductase [Variovorax sp. J22R193]MDM0062727.1 FAD-dependent oxidoreductase [Variovorax sp. J22G21]
MFSSDVIVIGGGLVGTAVAYGLGQLGKRISVLDEGDDAFRASRGNFGFIRAGRSLIPLSNRRASMIRYRNAVSATSQNQRTPSGNASSLKS